MYLGERHESGRPHKIQGTLRTGIAEIPDVVDQWRVCAVLGGLQNVVQSGARVLRQAPVRNKQQPLREDGLCAKCIVKNKATATAGFRKVLRVNTRVSLRRQAFGRVISVPYVHTWAAGAYIGNFRVCLQMPPFVLPLSEQMQQVLAGNCTK